jgi:hypothetical protein
MKTMAMAVVCRLSVATAAGRRRVRPGTAGTIACPLPTISFQDYRKKACYSHGKAGIANKLAVHAQAGSK